MPYKFGQFIQNFQQKCLFYKQEKCIIKSPEYKIKAGTVPESRAEPYYKYV